MITMSPTTSIALALLAGYMISAYAYPGIAMLESSARGWRSVVRRLVVLLVQATVALPVLGLTGQCTLLVILSVALAAQWPLIASPQTLRRFTRIQSYHLGGLLVAWILLTWSPIPQTAPGTPWSAAMPHGPAWVSWALSLGLVAFVLRGGMVITALVLRLFPSLPLDPDAARMGRTVGLLERALTLLLVVLGQWSAVALVVAAKSLARFEALKERHFAEYYLIGTLTSLLLASLGGLALRACLIP